MSQALEFAVNRPFAGKMTPGGIFSAWMRSMGSGEQLTSLNSSHKLHLLTAAQYADKLLGEVEGVLFASKSRSPFRKYKNPLSPAQIKVVEDYLARIRAQLVHGITARGVVLPEPQIDSVHSIRTTLAFIKVAFYDCAPQRMAGYGDVPQSEARELNGLMTEIVSVVDKLNSYLGQGLGQDLQSRLERLERSGGDVSIVKTLERIIDEHGLVEFRSVLSMIIDRLESKAFEIAFFGRVNSGKSSLLNAIAQSDVLPVGVNPITAMPTRLIYGSTPCLRIYYATRGPEELDISMLTEFATEERNPANVKQVSQVVVELPSARLHAGIALVDTPGLGSLATSGAAETLVYLPRCDLGVVLIDAGSTLTEDDLSTIRALYEAGTPVSLLLSKSDLLAPEDHVRSISYISQQVGARLGLQVLVHPVSVEPDHKFLLEDWFNRELLSFYERHEQLLQASLRRKIGSVREAVETALRIKVEAAETTSIPRQTDMLAIDARLRNALGRIEETRKLCLETTRQIENCAEPALAIASSYLIDNRPQLNTVSPTELVRDVIENIAVTQARRILTALRDLARDLTDALQATADDLGFTGVHSEDNLALAIKEMPRPDLGKWQVNIKPGFLAKVSKQMGAHRIEQDLRAQIATDLSRAFYSFGRMLDDWAQRALGEIQLRFDAHADAYRAHLHRLIATDRISQAEAVAIRRDLERLTESRTS